MLEAVAQRVSRRAARGGRRRALERRRDARRGARHGGPTASAALVARLRGAVGAEPVVVRRRADPGDRLGRAPRRGPTATTPRRSCAGPSAALASGRARIRPAPAASEPARTALHRATSPDRGRSAPHPTKHPPERWRVARRGAYFSFDPAESWGAPPGRTSNKASGEREMTQTLEGTAGRSPRPSSARYGASEGQRHRARRACRSRGSATGGRPARRDLGRSIARASTGRAAEGGRPVGVLVVDDSRVFRTGMTRAVQACDGMELLGEADGGEAAPARDRRARARARHPRPAHARPRRHRRAARAAGPGPAAGMPRAAHQRHARRRRRGRGARRRRRRHA